MSQFDIIRKVFALADKDMTLIKVEHMFVQRRYTARPDLQSNSSYFQLPHPKSFKFRLAATSNVKMVDKVITFDHRSEYETGPILSISRSCLIECSEEMLRVPKNDYVIVTINTYDLRSALEDINDDLQGDKFGRPKKIKIIPEDNTYTDVAAQVVVYLRKYKYDAELAPIERMFN